MNEKIKSIIALILGVFFAMVIAETILQIISIPQRQESGWTHCIEHEPCNYLGFRGEEIKYSPEDFIVALIGDSQVAALSIPFQQIPERQLERSLQKHRKNVRVFTLGTHGYGQDQQLLVLK